MEQGLGLALACVLGWVLLSARLSRWSVTAPIVLALAGYLLSRGSDPLVKVAVEGETVKTLAEITLALILFSDATQIRAGWFELPPARLVLRLLLIGLPLSILVGVGLGWWLLPGSPIAVVAVIAASLCATDAALSASVINDERIPLKLRQVINVESGLNDGLATPFVLFFVAAASALEAGTSVRTAATDAVVEIAIAVVVGVLVGGIGGWLMAEADRRGLSSPMQEPIGALVIALGAYTTALGVGGNGFVAAFVGGVAFGAAVGQHRPPQILDFTERSGLLLSFAIWFVFGAALLGPALDDLDWRIVLYAALSLTVVRMVPVALSLLGSGLRRDDVLLIGWLGPRGLASIVFALLALDAIGGPEGELVATVVTVTVALSVVLHGVTAGPTARWFAGRLPTSDRTAE